AADAYLTAARGRVARAAALAEPGDIAEEIRLEGEKVPVVCEHGRLLGRSALRADAARLERPKLVHLPPRQARRPSFRLKAAGSRKVVALAAGSERRPARIPAPADSAGAG